MHLFQLIFRKTLLLDVVLEEVETFALLDHSEAAFCKAYSGCDFNRTVKVVVLLASCGLLQLNYSQVDFEKASLTFAETLLAREVNLLENGREEGRIYDLRHCRAAGSTILSEVLPRKERNLDAAREQRAHDAELILVPELEGAGNCETEESRQVAIAGHKQRQARRQEQPCHKLEQVRVALEDGSFVRFKVI